MIGGSRTITGKLREEPLVPLGVAATVAAFLYASWGIHRNNTRMTQWGMRGRVAMQGLTLVALVGYGLYGARSYNAQRRGDVRQLDWEKLEREAAAAEGAAAPATPKPRSVFASEQPRSQE
ncbi:Respiratory supercomplex factor 1, mitochondrial [Coemansia javaensis]|uniref:Respiratory supercomplex factor 1, mitochondrial n=1 Tax=Coemansia javaensis TaxID=2761396 RepID=A0A9W8H5P7_9FUNG|nr:Respiratory supercomplex factor 1, mitochondrial [Coemansia javaensis]